MWELICRHQYYSNKQLCLFISRCTSLLNILVLLPEQSQESRRTFNVVYKEVFNSIILQIVCISNNGLEIDFYCDLRDKEISQNILQSIQKVEEGSIVD